MKTIRNLNKSIVFCLEVAMVVSLSFWGFHNHTAAASWIWGLGTPFIAALLWSIFAAPMSSRRLQMPYRAIFSLSIFWIAAILLYQTGLRGWALAFMTLSIITMGLAYVLEN